MWFSYCWLYLLVTVSLSSSIPSKLVTCGEGTWKLIQNNSFSTGHAKLQFKIDKGHESGSYTTILACGEIVVHGTGSQTVTINKWKTSYVSFGIVVPRPGVKGNVRDVKNNTCSFELRENLESQNKLILQCELKVMSVLSRIVPPCSDTSQNANKLLKLVRVMRDQGIVHLVFKSSPNNVVRVKHYCKNNPLRSMLSDEMEKEGVLVALNAFSGNERIYAASFYPDCDNFNASVRKLFMQKMDHDCYISVYAMCQDGMTLIKAFDVDLNKEAMICHAPKSSFTTTMEQARLAFRVDSTGIVLMLLFLLLNISLYVLICPCVITICVKELMKTGENLRSKKQKQPKKKKKPKKEKKGKKKKGGGADDDGGADKGGGGKHKLTIRRPRKSGFMRSKKKKKQVLSEEERLFNPNETEAGGFQDTELYAPEFTAQYEDAYKEDQMLPSENQDLAVIMETGQQRDLIDFTGSPLPGAPTSIQIDEVSTQSDAPTKKFRGSSGTFKSQRDSRDFYQQLQMSQTDSVRLSVEFVPKYYGRTSKARMNEERDQTPRSSYEYPRTERDGKELEAAMSKSVRSHRSSPIPKKDSLFSLEITDESFSPMEHASSPTSATDISREKHSERQPLGTTALSSSEFAARAGSSGDETSSQGNSTSALLSGKSPRLSKVYGHTWKLPKHLIPAELQKNFASLKEELDRAYQKIPGQVSPRKIVEWRENIVQATPRTSLSPLDLPFSSSEKRTSGDSSERWSRKIPVPAVPQRRPVKDTKAVIPTTSQRDRREQKSVISTTILTSQREAEPSAINSTPSATRESMLGNLSNKRFSSASQGEGTSVHMEFAPGTPKTGSVFSKPESEEFKKVFIPPLRVEGGPAHRESTGMSSRASKSGSVVSKPESEEFKKVFIPPSRVEGKPAHREFTGMSSRASKSGSVFSKPESEEFKKVFIPPSRQEGRLTEPAGIASRASNAESVVSKRDSEEFERVFIPPSRQEDKPSSTEFAPPPSTIEEKTASGEDIDRSWKDELSLVSPTALEEMRDKVLTLGMKSARTRSPSSVLDSTVAFTEPSPSLRLSMGDHHSPGKLTVSGFSFTKTSELSDVYSTSSSSFDFLDQSGKHKGLDQSGKHKGLDQSGKHKGLDQSGKHKGLDQSGKHSPFDQSDKYKDSFDQSDRRKDSLDQSGKLNYSLDMSTYSSDLGDKHKDSLDLPGKHKAKKGGALAGTGFDQTDVQYAPALPSVQEEMTSSTSELEYDVAPVHTQQTVEMASSTPGLEENNELDYELEAVHIQQKVEMASGKDGEYETAEFGVDLQQVRMASSLEDDLQYEQAVLQLPAEMTASLQGSDVQYEPAAIYVHQPSAETQDAEFEQQDATFQSLFSSEAAYPTGQDNQNTFTEQTEPPLLEYTAGLDRRRSAKTGHSTTTIEGLGADAPSRQDSILFGQGGTVEYATPEPSEGVGNAPSSISFASVEQGLKLQGTLEYATPEPSEGAGNAPSRQDSISFASVEQGLKLQEALEYATPGPSEGAGNAPSISFASVEQGLKLQGTLEYATPGPSEGAERSVPEQPSPFPHRHEHTDEVKGDNQQAKDSRNQLVKRLDTRRASSSFGSLEEWAVVRSVAEREKPSPSQRDDSNRDLWSSHPQRGDQTTVSHREPNEEFPVEIPGIVVDVDEEPAKEAGEQLGSSSPGSLAVLKEAMDKKYKKKHGQVSLTKIGKWLKNTESALANKSAHDGHLVGPFKEKEIESPDLEIVDDALAGPVTSRTSSENVEKFLGQHLASDDSSSEFVGPATSLAVLKEGLDERYKKKPGQIAPAKIEKWVNKTESAKSPHDGHLIKPKIENPDEKSLEIVDDALAGPVTSRTSSENVEKFLGQHLASDDSSSEFVGPATSLAVLKEGLDERYKKKPGQIAPAKIEKWVNKTESAITVKSQHEGEKKPTGDIITEAALGPSTIMPDTSHMQTIKAVELSPVTEPLQERDVGSVRKFLPEHLVSNDSSGEFVDATTNLDILKQSLDKSYKKKHGQIAPAKIEKWASRTSGFSEKKPTDNISKAPLGPSTVIPDTSHTQIKVSPMTEPQEREIGSVKSSENVSKFLATLASDDSSSEFADPATSLGVLKEGLDKRYKKKRGQIAPAKIEQWVYKAESAITVKSPHEGEKKLEGDISGALLGPSTVVMPDTSHTLTDGLVEVAKVSEPQEREIGSVKSSENVSNFRATLANDDSSSEYADPATSLGVLKENLDKRYKKCEQIAPNKIEQWVYKAESAITVKSGENKTTDDIAETPSGLMPGASPTQTYEDALPSTIKDAEIPENSPGAVQVNFDALKEDIDQRYEKKHGQVSSPQVEQWFEDHSVFSGSTKKWDKGKKKKTETTAPSQTGAADTEVDLSFNEEHKRRAHDSRQRDASSEQDTKRRQFSQSKKQSPQQSTDYGSDRHMSVESLPKFVKSLEAYDDASEGEKQQFVFDLKREPSLRRSGITLETLPLPLSKELDALKSDSSQSPPTLSKIKEHISKYFERESKNFEESSEEGMSGGEGALPSPTSKKKFTKIKKRFDKEYEKKHEKTVPNQIYTWRKEVTTQPPSLQSDEGSSVREYLDSHEQKRGDDSPPRAPGSKDTLQVKASVSGALSAAGKQGDEDRTSVEDLDKDQDKIEQIERRGAGQTLPEKQDSGPSTYKPLSQDQPTVVPKESSESSAEVLAKDQGKKGSEIERRSAGGRRCRSSPKGKVQRAESADNTLPDKRDSGASTYKSRSVQGISQEQPTVVPKEDGSSSEDLTMDQDKKEDLAKDQDKKEDLDKDHDKKEDLAKNQDKKEDLAMDQDKKEDLDKDHDSVPSQSERRSAGGRSSNRARRASSPRSHLQAAKSVDKTLSGREESGESSLKSKSIARVEGQDQPQVVPKEGVLDESSEENLDSDHDKKASVPSQSGRRSAGGRSPNRAHHTPSSRDQLQATKSVDKTLSGRKESGESSLKSKSAARVEEPPGEHRVVRRRVPRSGAPRTAGKQSVDEEDLEKKSRGSVPEKGTPAVDDTLPDGASTPKDQPQVVSKDGVPDEGSEEDLDKEHDKKGSVPSQSGRRSGSRSPNRARRAPSSRDQLQATKSVDKTLSGKKESGESSLKSKSVARVEGPPGEHRVVRRRVPRSGAPRTAGKQSVDEEDLDKDHEKKSRGSVPEKGTPAVHDKDTGASTGVVPKEGVPDESSKEDLDKDHDKKKSVPSQRERRSAGSRSPNRARRAPSSRDQLQVTKSVDKTLSGREASGESSSLSRVEGPHGRPPGEPRVERRKVPTSGAPRIAGKQSVDEEDLDKDHEKKFRGSVPEKGAPAVDDKDTGAPTRVVPKEGVPGESSKEDLDKDHDKKESVPSQRERRSAGLRSPNRARRAPSSRDQLQATKSIDKTLSGRKESGQSSLKSKSLAGPPGEPRVVPKDGVPDESSEEAIDKEHDKKESVPSQSERRSAGSRSPNRARRAPSSRDQLQAIDKTLSGPPGELDKDHDKKVSVLSQSGRRSAGGSNRARRTPSSRDQLQATKPVDKTLLGREDPGESSLAAVKEPPEGQLEPTSGADEGKGEQLHDPKRIRQSDEASGVSQPPRKPDQRLRRPDDTDDSRHRRAHTFGSSRSPTKPSARPARYFRTRSYRSPKRRSGGDFNTAHAYINTETPYFPSSSTLAESDSGQNLPQAMPTITTRSYSTQNPTSSSQSCVEDSDSYPSQHYPYVLPHTQQEEAVAYKLASGTQFVNDLVDLDFSDVGLSSGDGGAMSSSISAFGVPSEGISVSTSTSSLKQQKAYWTMETSASPFHTPLSSSSAAILETESPLTQTKK